MPVVLVEVGGVARSGHLYGDRTGIEYEYPAGRYEAWIQRGDRFVYQVPGVGYIGVGIIGEIRASPTAGRLICTVLAVRLFESPVGLKDGQGIYYETDPTYWKDKVYWGQGVRPLSDSRFDAIVSATHVTSTVEPDLGLSGYGDPVTTKLVEQISVAVALAEMEVRFNEEVREMPHNNPGFDLLVGSELAPVRYVEVKGTQSISPVFFMSEGEREFAMRNSTLYTIVVVTGIDVRAGTHAHVVVRDGAIQGSDVEMQPSQWRGRFVVTSHPTDNPSDT